MKGAPKEEAFAGAIALGYVSQLDVERGNQYTIHPFPELRVGLLWLPAASALVWLEGAVRSRARNAVIEGDLADLFAAWTANRRDPVRFWTVQVPTLARGRWRSIGRAAAIIYRSDKFNNRRTMVRFRHEFEAGVQAATQESDGVRVWAVWGGDLRIDEPGIEG